MADHSYVSWVQEDVSKWLGSLNLHHLVPSFERMQIDGSRLATLNEQDLKIKMRLKPAEVMAVRGAINKLVDDTARSNRVQNRKVSGTPKSARERTASFEPASLYNVDDKRAKTVPREIHRNTIATDKMSLYKQPKLVPGSAPKLLDKECKYSGWIRKQGGGYKNCEFLFYSEVLVGLHDA